MGIRNLRLYGAGNELLYHVAPRPRTIALDALIAAGDWSPTDGSLFTIVIMTAGTLVVEDAEGTQVTLTSTANQYEHPGLLSKIKNNVANTATGVYAVY